MSHCHVIIFDSQRVLFLQPGGVLCLYVSFNVFQLLIDFDFLIWTSPKNWPRAPTSLLHCWTASRVKTGAPHGTHNPCPGRIAAIRWLSRSTTLVWHMWLGGFLDVLWAQRMEFPGNMEFYNDSTDVHFYVFFWFIMTHRIHVWYIY